MFGVQGLGSRVHGSRGHEKELDRKQSRMFHNVIPSALDCVCPLHGNRAYASGTENNFGGSRLVSTFRCRVALVAEDLIQTASVS